MGDLRKPAGQQRSMLGETCSKTFGHTVSESNTSYCYHHVHSVKYHCKVLVCVCLDQVCPLLRSTQNSTIIWCLNTEIHDPQLLDDQSMQILLCYLVKAHGQNGTWQCCVSCWENSLTFFVLSMAFSMDKFRSSKAARTFSYSQRCWEKYSSQRTAKKRKPKKKHFVS